MVEGLPRGLEGAALEEALQHDQKDKENTPHHGNPRASVPSVDRPLTPQNVGEMRELLEECNKRLTQLHEAAAQNNAKAEKRFRAELATGFTGSMLSSFLDGVAFNGANIALVGEHSKALVKTAYKLADDLLAQSGLDADR